MKTILVTGCFGFIGSNFVRYMLSKYPDYRIIGLDAMTYAARPAWIHEYLERNPHAKERFGWVVCDLANEDRTAFVIKSFAPEHVIHFAAESHVCRSIETPRKFLDSNVVGTYNLLEALRGVWKNGHHRFHQISTDEVYGELELNTSEMFHEEHIYAPRSPYAASKAAADHWVKAFHHTYGIDAVITNCSNNYGPNQDNEKLIPKTITRLLNNEPVEIYGNGTQVRDWLWVGDHCEAIDKVFHSGTPGETYCVGGNNQLSNLEVVKKVHDAVSKILKVELKIVHTNARPTDDQRYAIDTTKLQSLGWAPKMTIEQGLEQTVKWYSGVMRQNNDTQGTLPCL